MIAPAARRKLVSAARAVRARAHAPYSRFKVGAAVLDERGRVHVGCNVENASYGLTVCAERNAVAAAVAAGAKRIRAAVVVSEGEVTPCGACRQILAEFGGPDTEVNVVAPRGGGRAWPLRVLLPEAFAFHGPRRRSRAPTSRR